ncbi:hypothetical protein GC194_11165 [bacterium]|nr:hypothetical protein [bacterium]
MRALLFIFSLSVLLFATSCFPTTYTTTVEPIQPKFVSIEKILQLKLNSSYGEVVNTLGQVPYNVLSAQTGEYTIYSYWYRLIEREVNPKKAVEIGGETEGDPIYRESMQNLFLFFKDNKLEAYVTTQGLNESTWLIMMNNTLYKVSKEKGDFIILPATDEDKEEMEKPGGDEKPAGFINGFF